LPRNDKWRKLNLPKQNYSHLSQFSGANLTTPKYLKIQAVVSVHVKRKLD